MNNEEQRDTMPGMVAWTMADGHTMAGRDLDPDRDSANVVRVDGSTVSVPRDKLRPATVDDVQRACGFYNSIPQGPPQ